MSDPLCGDALALAPGDLARAQRQLAQESAGIYLGRYQRSVCEKGFPICLAGHCGRVLCRDRPGTKPCRRIAGLHGGIRISFYHQSDSSICGCARGDRNGSGACNLGKPERSWQNPGIRMPRRPQRAMIDLEGEESHGYSPNGQGSMQRQYSQKHRF